MEQKKLGKEEFTGMMTNFESLGQEDVFEEKQEFVRDEGNMLSVFSLSE